MLGVDGLRPDLCSGCGEILLRNQGLNEPSPVRTTATKGFPQYKYRRRFGAEDCREGVPADVTSLRTARIGSTVKSARWYSRE